MTLVPIFRTDQPSLLALATMALDEAKIDYQVRDATEFPIITGGGLRRLSPGNEVARVVIVTSEDAARARDLVAEASTG
jgi:hypothetical protein